MIRPKVSVIMCVYNNVSSVEASIESIVDQTFQDWEMILWNDASTDGTLEKLLKWQNQDKRIKVFSNEKNLGWAASSNLAIEKTQGEYIARMDGDDVSMPERLMKQVEILDRNPRYAIVGGGCILFDGSGEWGIRNTKAEPLKKDFLWGSPFMNPTTVIRKDVLLAVEGFRVTKDTLRSEDYDIFMRIYALGYIGYNIQEPLIKYCENRKPRRIQYSYYISEAIIRYRGFKALGLLPKGFPYILKPLIVALIPGKWKRRLQEQKNNKLEGGI